MKHVAKPMHTRVREEAIPQSSRVFAKLSGYVKWIPLGGDPDAGKKHL